MRGRKITDEEPGFGPVWANCIVPGQKGWGRVRQKEISYNSSIVAFLDFSYFKAGNALYVNSFNPVHGNVKCLMFTLPTAFMSSKFAEIRGADIFNFHAGVIVAVIPISWKLFSPSNVFTLWSILSAMYWIVSFAQKFEISVPLVNAALCSKRWTSLYELQKPCSCTVNKKSRSNIVVHLDSKSCLQLWY